MARGEAVSAPMCKLCNHAHWLREPHIWGKAKRGKNEDQEALKGEYEVVSAPRATIVRVEKPVRGVRIGPVSTTVHDIPADPEPSEPVALPKPDLSTLRALAAEVKAKPKHRLPLSPKPAAPPAPAQAIDMAGETDAALSVAERRKAADRARKAAKRAADPEAYRASQAKLMRDKYAAKTDNAAQKTKAGTPEN